MANNSSNIVYNLDKDRICISVYLLVDNYVKSNSIPIAENLTSFSINEWLYQPSDLYPDIYVDKRLYTWIQLYRNHLSQLFELFPPKNTTDYYINLANPNQEFKEFCSFLFSHSSGILIDSDIV